MRLRQLGYRNRLGHILRLNTTLWVHHAPVTYDDIVLHESLSHVCILCDIVTITELARHCFACIFMCNHDSWM